MFSALILNVRAGLATRLLNANVIQMSRNGYKSSISLEKLYPKSKHDYLTQAEINSTDNLEKFNGFIPIGKNKQLKSFSKIEEHV